MCGIFGVISNNDFSHQQLAFLEDAMQVGQVRGTDGAGILSIKKTGDVVLRKKASTGTEFLKNAKATKGLRQHLAWAYAAIGHNRAGTKGANSDVNTHPFHFGHIWGVHNGTVSDFVLNKIDPEKGHEVDSARIYQAISKAQDPLDVLRGITSGSYSLVWFNDKTKTIHFARNKERPMSIGITETGLYFASEMGMLGWLLARHKLTGWKKDIELAQTDVHTLYSVSLENPEEVTAQTYEPKDPFPAVSRLPVKTVVAKSRNTKQNKPKKSQNKVREIVSRVIDEHKKNRDAASSDDGDAGLDITQSCGQTFGRETDIGLAFPRLESDADFLSDIISYDSAFDTFTFPAVICGYQIHHDTSSVSFVGYACTDSGVCSDAMNVLTRITVKNNARAANLMQYVPSPNDIAKAIKAKKEVKFPIIELLYDDVTVRPTGELIANSSAYHLQGKPEMTELADTDEIGWALFACDNGAYEGQFTDVQLAELWAKLADPEADGVLEQ